MARSRKKAAASSADSIGPAAGILDAVLAFVAELGAVDCKPRVVQFAIDGLVYTSSKLPATVGLEIWPRLAALLGSGFTKAIASGDAGDIDGAALLRIANRAMEDGLVPLVKSLLVNMQCGKLAGGTKAGPVLPAFDDHFAGEYGHLLKVAAFAVAHNLRGPTYGAR